MDSLKELTDFIKTRSEGVSFSDLREVFKDEDGDEFICCPNAPMCNGSVIDWVDLV